MSDPSQQKEQFASSLRRVLEMPESDFMELVSGLSRIAEYSSPKERVAELSYGVSVLGRDDLLAAISAGADFYDSGFTVEQASIKAKNMLKHLGLSDPESPAISSSQSGFEQRVEKIILAFAPSQKFADIRKAMYDHGNVFTSASVTNRLHPVITIKDKTEELHAIASVFNMEIFYVRDGDSRSFDCGLDLEDIDELIGSLERAKRQSKIVESILAKPEIKFFNNSNEL